MKKSNSRSTIAITWDAIDCEYNKYKMCSICHSALMAKLDRSRHARLSSAPKYTRTKRKDNIFLVYVRQASLTYVS